jgi:hypothetical protein
VSGGNGDFWTISSSDSIPSATAADISPSMFGVWYRQTTRIVRPGAIVAYNLCGAPQVTTETAFHDYAWDVSLGEDAQCPPLPDSGLPPAQCFIAPCATSD